MDLPPAYNFYYAPPLLQDLIAIDHLLVKQKIELFSQNKYTIKNRQGQVVYHAEDNSCCSPTMSSINISDNHEKEIIRLCRNGTCGFVNCFPFCCQNFQKLEVYSPPGKLIGLIEEIYSWSGSKFDIKNENGNVVLKIKGPDIPFSCCGEDVDFKILSVDESVEVGKISKQWSGLMREFFSDASYFGVSFPLDLDVRIKAVLLGACFLIDYLYFEDRNC